MRSQEKLLRKQQKAGASRTECLYASSVQSAYRGTTQIQPQVDTGHCCT
jgi:hypothetical protein